MLRVLFTLLLLTTSAAANAAPKTKWQLEDEAMDRKAHRTMLIAGAVLVGSFALIVWLGIRAGKRRGVTYRTVTHLDSGSNSSWRPSQLASSTTVTPPPSGSSGSSGGSSFRGGGASASW
jgi:uncharacterized membrane protein YgcG